MAYSLGFGNIVPQMQNYLGNLVTDQQKLAADKGYAANSGGLQILPQMLNTLNNGGLAAVAPGPTDLNVLAPSGTYGGPGFTAGAPAAPPVAPPPTTLQSSSGQYAFGGGGGGIARPEAAARNLGPRTAPGLTAPRPTGGLAVLPQSPQSAVAANRNRQMRGRY